MDYERGMCLDCTTVKVKPTLEQTMKDQNGC
jgi:hypothetical protein